MFRVVNSFHDTKVDHAVSVLFPVKCFLNYLISGDDDRCNMTTERSMLFGTPGVDGRFETTTTGVAPRP